MRRKDRYYQLIERKIADGIYLALSIFPWKTKRAIQDSVEEKYRQSMDSTFTNNNNYLKEISVSLGGAWLAKVELFKNFIMLLLFFAVLIDTSRQKFPRNNRNKLENRSRNHVTASCVLDSIKFK